MNFRSRLIALVSIIVLTLASIVSLFLVQEHTRYKGELIKTSQESFSTSIESFQRNLNKHYSTRFKAFIQMHPLIVKAFSSHDRKKLQEETWATFNILKQDNKFVVSMYYISPDNTVFLRVHRPDYYGDNIQKVSPLAARVNQTQTAFSGMENVKKGLRYRFCEPVFDKGQYIGMVGISIDIRSMLRFEKINNTEIELLFTKQQTEYMELLTDKLIPLHNSFLPPDSSVLFTDLPNIPLSTDGKTVEIANHKYSVFIGGTLTDVQGKELARILAAIDITTAVNGHWQRMRTIFFMTFALLAALGMTLYFSFGRMLNRISGLKNDLQNQNLMLEEIVIGRTISLENEIEQRKKSDRKYKDLVENSSDWIWEMDASYNFTYSNPRVTDVTGYSPQEIISTQPFIYIAPNDKTRVQSFLAERAIDQVPINSFKCSILHKNGQIITIETNGVPILSGKGNLLGYRCVTRDVTQQMKARNQEQLFLDVFRQSEDAILIMKNEHIIDCNTAAIRMLRAKDKTALLRSHPTDLSPLYQPDGQLSKEKAKKVFEVMAEQSFYRFEWLHQRLDGSVFPCTITITKTVLSDETVLHTLWQDLSEQKEHEQHLRVFRAAMEQSLDGIAMSDFDGKLQFVNSSWAKMHGYDREDLVDKKLSAFHTEDQLKQDVEPFNKQVMLMGFNSGEIGHVTRDGRVFPTYMSVSVINDANGKPMGIVAIAHDITENKKRESLEQAMEAAELANKTKSEFLANMSHELRTPMHGILSYAGFGVHRINKVSREKLRDYFMEIEDSGNRLLLLLNDLLDLAKLEAGKMQYEIETRDVGLVIEECLHEFKAMAAEKQIQLKYVYPDQQLKAWFDINRIGQVMRNLFSNAIKFSKQGQEITISYSEDTTILYGREQPAVKISIADNGVGVPDGELETIFDKFIQSSKTKTGAGGTGLGLPICKEIIQNHKGAKIWAENNPEGGTIFNLVLLKRNK